MPDTSTWAEVSQILFNFSAIVAGIWAAIRYGLILGGGRKNLEISIKTTLLARTDTAHFFEATWTITNKGLELFEAHNVFLAATQRVPVSDSMWSTVHPNYVSEADGLFWLHPGTSIHYAALLEVPLNVSIVELEVLVPHRRKRLPRPETISAFHKVKLLNPGYDSMTTYIANSDRTLN